MTPMTKTKLLLKSKAELMKLAKRLGLRGISTMNKPDLAEEIAEARQKNKAKIAVAKAAAKPAAKSKAPLKRRARRKTSTTSKLVLKARPSRKRAATRIAAPRKSVEAVMAKPQATKPATSAPKPPVKPTVKPAVEESLGDLPASYGTGKLFLTARDPHWLYAYWDLSPDQMAAHAKQAVDEKVLLQLFENSGKEPIREFPVNHGTRDSYISVNNAGTSYQVRLVIRRKNGSVQTISKSGTATTPPEDLATSTPPQFVSIPVDIPYTELMDLARSYSREGETLAETLHRLESDGFNLPYQVSLPVGPWTSQQTNELEQILTGEFMTRRQVGSAEVSEWVARRRQPGSAVFSEFRPLGASMFSPAGASWGKKRGKGFWFAVNAELIIYGATEPDATVTIDGKPIQLRPDGTFTFHYTFPDGHYKLPVVAVSRDGDDRRTAELTFDRRTEEQGEVGKVAQPQHLKSPAHAP
jgi:hypothetical protein